MIYLLHGQDSYSSAARLRALRRELDPNGFNGATLDGQEATLDALRSACDVLAFFGGGRCVDVRGLLTRWGAGAAGGSGSGGGRRGGRARGGGGKASGVGAGGDGPLEALAAYLPTMAPTTTLIFWEPGPVELPPALARAFKELGASVERFEAPYGPELRRWLLRRAEEEGIAIRPDAAVALLNAACPHGWQEPPRGWEAAPPDLQRIDTELQKLATAVRGRPDGEAITAGDVAALVVGESAPRVFDLVNAVADGNTGAALGHLRALLDEGVAPEAVLPLLATQFGLLARLRAAGQGGQGGRGGDTAALAARLGQSPGRLHHATRRLAQLGEARVARALEVILEADAAIKTGRATRSDDALYWAVLELCRAGPPGPALLHANGGA